LAPDPAPARQGLFARAVSVLLKPSETFDRIADEATSVPEILTGYILPLAAIGPVCGAIGASLVGTRAGVHVPWVWSILAAVTAYILSVGMVFVLGFITFTLAPRFGGRQDVMGALKLAAYASTATFVAGIFGLVPAVSFLAGFGLYGVYLIYAGLPWLMKSPANKSPLYTAAVAVCAVAMAVIIALVAGRLMALGTVHSHGDAGVAGLAPAPASTSAARVSAAPIRVADARTMLTLMPPLFNGVTRADTTIGSDDGISTAEATYSFGYGSIHLKMSDSTTVLTFAGTGANGTSEIVRTDGNQVTRESYDAASKSGRYIVVLNGHTSLEADGSGVDMATMKALAGQIDLTKVDAGR
jgi:hypothetical protein